MKRAIQVGHKAGVATMSVGEARILDSLDDRGPQNVAALVLTTGLNEEQVKRHASELLRTSRIARKMTRTGMVYERFNV